MTQEALNKRIKTTTDLRGIVSTMKMLSSVSVGQFEKALKSLNQYNENLQTAFQGLFAQEKFKYTPPTHFRDKKKVLVIAIGTDNGLVGRFNRDIINTMKKNLSFEKNQIKLITVGKRLAPLALSDNYSVISSYNNSNTVKEISTLSTAILTKIDQSVRGEGFSCVWLLYTLRKNTGLEVQIEQLIPFQESLLTNLKTKKWSGKTLPLVTANYNELFSALIREYLTIVLAHALTSSLVAEHYTRMMHMQQAEKNIDEKLNELQLIYQQARQNQITDELIDIVSGAEAINKIKRSLDKPFKNA